MGSMSVGILRFHSDTADIWTSTMTCTDSRRSDVRFREVRALCVGVVLLVSLLGVVPPVAAQDDAPLTWTAHLRSTAYFYQSEVPDGSGQKLNYAPLYEHFDASIGRLADGHLDFRVSGRFATDMADDEAIVTEDKLYVAYANVRAPWADGRVRLGRQFLQEGTNRHTLDGVWLGFQPITNWRVHAWAGGEAPVARNFEASEFGDDGAFGVRVVGRVHRRARVGAWFATRQSGGETTATPLGGELMVAPMPEFRALVRGSFDAESEEMERVDLLTQITPGRDLPVFTIQYVDRKPIIEGSSFFSIFADDLERISLLRGSARYEHASGFGGELEAARSAVDDRSTNRVGLAAIVPHARLGVGFTSGDAGEEFRLYGDAHYRFFHALDVSVGAVFADYALVEDAPDDETRDLVTTFVRARYELTDGVRLRGEFQALENPLFSDDVRILLGLDLMAGRGASRYGLGAGGDQ